MTRLNTILLLVLIGCALSVVTSQHKGGRSYQAGAPSLFDGDARKAIGRGGPDLMGDVSDTTAVETRMRRYA